MEAIHVLVLDTVMDRGGAEAMIMNYMRNINRELIQFDFLTNREYKAAYEEEIEGLGGRVYHMCPMYPGKFRQYKKEVRTFLKEHPEYQIIHSNLEERSYFALKEAKKLGVPVRISHSHNRPLGFNPKLIVRYYFRFMLKYYNTHMFSCGVEAGDWLYGKKNRDRVIIMNNAIDAAQYTYDKKKSENMKKIFGVEDKLVIGHVGRFFAQKNHPFLIDIFNEIHKKNPDTALLLVGGGELDDALKNQMKQKVEDLGLSDSVQFLGVREDVNEVMQAFDLFLLPSLFEGLPVTMVEAQAGGLPCVISDKVPVQCDITGNVKVVPLKESPEKWADVVLDFVSEFERKDTFEKIKKAGFDIKENAKWLEEFYVKSLKEGKGI
jgi:glycosyltransferase involved in cell wall biosynthesis